MIMMSGSGAYARRMASWDDVSRIALALPGTTESATGSGTLQWRVKNKGFVWERPLGRGDREALGDDAPDGPILGACVPDLGERSALLDEAPDVYFLIPHYEGFAGILVRLERIAVPALRELVVEAWLVRAPKRLAQSYLESEGDG
jgi:hypothetical protein